MYRYIAIAIAAGLIGFTGGWKTQGWRLNNKIGEIVQQHSQQMQKLQELALNAEKDYREKERSYIISLTNAQEQRNEEVATINQRHAALVHSLRKRPERVAAVFCPGTEVPEPTPACVGTTGAELAKGDAEFLAGYAADAARLDAELTKCEAAYNALRQ